MILCVCYSNMRPKMIWHFFILLMRKIALAFTKYCIFYTSVHETERKDGRQEMLCNKWVWTAGEHLQLQEVRRVLRSPDCCTESESLETIHDMP